MKDEFYFFWRGPFSQWAKYPIVIAGITYCTAEQYMMAEKARLFGDIDTEARILAAQSPREQKSLGRQVNGFEQEKWGTVCEEIVYQGNLAKFSQHAELRALLLSTGDKIIAEASPEDRIWGIGMAEDDPKVTDTSQWGTNLLGIALMRVREKLRSEDCG